MYRRSDGIRTHHCASSPDTAMVHTWTSRAAVFAFDQKRRSPLERSTVVSQVSTSISVTNDMPQSQSERSTSPFLSPVVFRRGSLPTLTRTRLFFHDKADPYYEFTNVSSHPVWYNSQCYPTSDHLFHALKVSRLTRHVLWLISFFQSFFRIAPTLPSISETAPSEPPPRLDASRRQ